jgi:hypothetical protein
MVKRGEEMIVVREPFEEPVMRKIPLLFLLVLFVVGALPLGAQTFSPNILPDVSSPASEFPLWAHDLRRGEIITFGTFPFTMFFSTMAMDSIRYFDNNSDERYAPWPFKGPGAIEMSREEREKTFTAAILASVAIAAIDFAIVQVKRNKEKQRVEQQSNGREIRITRTSIVEDEKPDEDVVGGSP